LLLLIFIGRLAQASSRQIAGDEKLKDQQKTYARTARDYSTMIGADCKAIVASACLSCYHTKRAEAKKIRQRGFTEVRVEAIST